MQIARRIQALALVAAALALPAAHAAAGEDTRPRSITVVGAGTERGAPDTASLQLTVEHTAETAAAATRAAAESADRVIAALRTEVGPEGRVDTAGFSVSPVYRHDVERSAPGKPSRPEIVGYVAVNQVRVETRKVREVGALIDAAIAAGAARVGGLSFTIADPAPFQARALKAAGRDAASQAGAIAEALGVRLAHVLHASTETGVVRPVDHMGRMALAAEAMTVPTPIEPGEVVTEARLRVTYAIE
jgi:uncharacterized protein YggE